MNHRNLCNSSTLRFRVSPHSAVAPFPVVSRLSLRPISGPHVPAHPCPWCVCACVGVRETGTNNVCAVVLPSKTKRAPWMRSTHWLALRSWKLRGCCLDVRKRSDSSRHTGGGGLQDTGGRQQRSSFGRLPLATLGERSSGDTGWGLRGGYYLCLWCGWLCCDRCVFIRSGSHFLIGQCMLRRFRRNWRIVDLDRRSSNPASATR